MKGISPALHDISVWETKAAIFLVGKSQSEVDSHVVLEIARPGSKASGATSTSTNHTKLRIREHPTRLRSNDIQEYLQTRTASGSQRLACTVESAKFCMGFIRLLESSYLLLVLESEVVASIHGHLVYSITKVAPPISITYRPRVTIEESRYKSLLQSIDFAQGFYYSYTYDLTHTLQQQLGPQTEDSPTDSGQFMTLNDSFVWNYYALKPIIQQSADNYDGAPTVRNWCVPVIHGFIAQRELALDSSASSEPSASVDSSDARVMFTLIARRSRHFAGVRYLRRGIDTEGAVANDVETEQIVTVTKLHNTSDTPNNSSEDQTPEAARAYIMRSSSMVQVRGSIPLFWSHTNYFVPNAPIHIEHGHTHEKLSQELNIRANSGDSDSSKETKTDFVDDIYPFMSQLAFLRHFASLQHRFGPSITALSLVSVTKHTRECPVGELYESACSRPPVWVFDELCLPMLLHSEAQLLHYLNNEDNDISGNSGSGITVGNAANVLMTKVAGLLDVRNYLSLPQMIMQGTGTESTADESKQEHDAPEVATADSSEATKCKVSMQSKLQQYKEIMDTMEMIAHTKAQLHDMRIKHIAYDLHNRHRNGSHAGHGGPTVSKRQANGSKVRNHSPDSKEATKHDTLVATSETIEHDYVTVSTPAVTPNKDEVASITAAATALDTMAAVQNDPDVLEDIVDKEAVEELFEDAFTEQEKDQFGDVFDELSIICSTELDRIGVFLQSADGKRSSPDTNENEDKGSYEPCARFIQRSRSSRDVLDDDAVISAGRGLLQTGVLRTNCIDCLDRTNIGQFCYAKEALLLQLRLLLGEEYCAGRDMRDAVFTCMECWADHGDIIARQYAGSGAMHRVDRHPHSHGTVVAGASGPMFTITGGVQNAVVAVQRYTSNISSDYDRQQAMDLLLGVYQPTKDNNVAIWDVNPRPEHMRFNRLHKTRILQSAALRRQLAATKQANAPVTSAAAATSESINSPEKGDSQAVDTQLLSPEDLISTSLWVYEADNARNMNAYVGCFHPIVLPAEDNSGTISLQKTLSEVKNACITNLIWTKC
jgi:hypothetical protein